MYVTVAGDAVWAVLLKVPPPLTILHAPVVAAPLTLAPDNVIAAGVNELQEFKVGPAVAIGLLTATVTVPVICVVQLVTVFLANTLYVVVLLKLPVGKLMLKPVPATALPTFTLPVLFLNW